MIFVFAVGFVAVTALAVFLNGEALVRRWEAFRTRYVDYVARQFDDLYIKRSPQQVFAAHMALVLVAFLVGTFVIGAIFGAFLAAVVGFFPILFISRTRTGRLAKFDQQLIDALMSMSSSVKAGLVLPQAIQVVVDTMEAPISEEFSLTLKEHRLGVTLDEALQGMSERLRSRFLDMVVTGLLIARSHGGNVAATFEDTAQAIREIHRLEEQIKTMTAQGRMQGWVIGSLPFVFAFIVYLVDYEYISILWHDPKGLVLIGIILFAELFGVLMIRRILAADV